MAGFALRPEDRRARHFGPSNRLEGTRGKVPSVRRTTEYVERLSDLI